MTIPSGPPASLANLSARQVKDLGLLTSGTYGPPGSTSFESDSLSASLANSLQRKLDSLGWSLFKLIWKPRDMPSGGQIYALRGSARSPEDRTIFVNDSTGVLQSWPTPTARDHKDGSSVGTAETNGLLGRVAWLAGWPTPVASDEKWRYSNQDGAMKRLASGKQMCLESVAHLAAPLLGWASPTASDGSGGRTKKTEGGGGAYLDVQARLAGWPTPLAAPTGPESHGQSSGKYREKVLEMVGEPSISSSATTPKVRFTGRLRSGHSRWLQRIPTGWANYLPTATRSTRKQPKPSSKRGPSTRPSNLDRILG